MATIKSFTDIPQSKVLSQILPSETADMGWYYTLNPNAARNQMWVGTKAENADIPCWSLSALLDVLPKGTNISTPNPMNELNYCCWNHYDEIYADNPVDACYEMILKYIHLKI